MKGIEKQGQSLVPDFSVSVLKSATESGYLIGTGQDTDVAKCRKVLWTLKAFSC